MNQFNSSLQIFFAEGVADDVVGLMNSLPSRSLCADDRKNTFIGESAALFNSLDLHFLRDVDDKNAVDFVLPKSALKEQRNIDDAVGRVRGFERFE